jgi:phage anti-repressor protein
MDNQIIKINTDTDGKQTVDARELHEFLESKQKFADWIDAKILNNPFFRENADFMVFRNITNNTKGGRPRTDYSLTLETAKRVAMAEQTEKGEVVRSYFIQCETTLINIANNHTDLSYTPSHLKDVVEVKLLTTEYLRKMLNYSEPSVLKLVYDIHQEHNISTGYLPNYVENQKVSFSLTDLLQKHGFDISAKAMNQKLMEVGLLEEKQRRSTSSKTGYKKFKALTQAGLLFGHNDVSPKNKNEVMPRYYEDTFNNLLKEVLNEN